MTRWEKIKLTVGGILFMLRSDVRDLEARWIWGAR